MCVTKLRKSKIQKRFDNIKIDRIYYYGQIITSLGYTEGQIENGQIKKHERKYIDFIVSGQLLSEVLQTKIYDMISSLGWGVNTDYEKLIIKEFLKQGSPQLATGRTSIYCCSECGDIGCGAITADIVDSGDKIIWKDFGYENDYSDIDLENYKHIPRFNGWISIELLC